ncbi:MAG: ABC transporter ATP-binding protein [Candidatus Thiodiazotropha sp. (ex Myrtea sp. 'scaly one' KF741663)]|nr:ABC transporter ATP-binding protein [Candidatus Thiodiazotropha sp. (ex Myrtea sp. 'scaly one' KF741663)]
MNDRLLRVSGLNIQLKRAGQSLSVVDDLDLNIAQGETVALLGESGCGKSMTALAMMGLLPPGGTVAQGKIEFEGRDLCKLPDHEIRRMCGGSMGMIFQEPMTSLNPVLRVGVQIAEAVRLHDKPREGTEKRVVELLSAVGIPDPEKRVKAYPHQLSGGMKQRIMIAMALAGRPRLLIADEPTTALDVTIQAQVLKLLKDLQREMGMAILLITHDLGVVAEAADRLAVMYAGQIVETSNARDFFRQPRHPYSRMLLESLPDSQRRDEKLAVIKGAVPPLDTLFTGCRFVDRCNMGGSRCNQAIPQWQNLDSESGVRCLLYGDNSEAVSKQNENEMARHSSLNSTHEELLLVEGLEVHFPIYKGVLRRVVGHLRAVDGIDLTLTKGRTLAIVGESGCGKTTTGKGILQLIRPTSGRVLFESEELTRLKGEALRRKRAEMQIIFQDPMASMNPRLRVGSIVEEGLRAQKIYSKAQREQRVTELLKQVGLSDDAVNRYPHEFSGGQRQRICIARALAMKPKLIVCDEPTSALDVSIQAQILNLLKALQHSLKLSYLFITHNISVVAYLADEVAVMYLGRIVERGRVDEVLDSPSHPYTRALMSAVPVADPDRKRHVIQLEGDMPSPLEPPCGCHFHPRCPDATEQCMKDYPQEKPISTSHRVCCHHAETVR